MASNPLIIILDQATKEQIDAVHQIVKENANGWWHHFTNTWMLFSERNPDKWSDLIKDAIKEGNTSILIFALPPEKKQRLWQYWGIDAEKRTEWIKKNYGP